MKNFFTALMLLAGLFYSCSQTENKNETADSTDKVRSSHCKPKTTDKDWYSDTTIAPKFEGLDGIDFNITTSNPEAQEYFNQGMMLSYGFNHAEAARSFYQAIRLDSTCAMCYWGFAYVLGPNYNAGMEPDNFERAYDAVQKALTYSAGCTEKEKDFINALAVRYAQQPPDDRSQLDIDYSSAMKKVFEKYPDDAEAGALYAESMMDLHPWDLYEKHTKKPKPWTPEITKVLEELMILHPEHPGAHHFYIHAVEASEHPEKGLASAEIFETLVPGAGHLVHMPSHIYINTGDYHLGSLANMKAVEVDSGYVTTCHAQGAYPLAYYPHNWHFLAATATLEGDSKLAWKAARQVQENTAVDLLEEPGWSTLQHYFTVPYYVAVKFAMWDTILASPMPDSSLIYPRAVLHYARGMAYCGKGETQKAEDELTSLKVLAADTSLEGLTIWGINTTADLMRIAVDVLAGKIAVNKKNYDSAIMSFKDAVAVEDKLNYDEPPDWFFSVRHHLGDVLLMAGKYKEAEQVYKDDLKTWRKNGWALNGLAIAYEKQNKKEDAQKTKLMFDAAWQYADVVLDGSEVR